MITLLTIVGLLSRFAGSNEPLPPISLQQGDGQVISAGQTNVLSTVLTNGIYAYPFQILYGSYRYSYNEVLPTNTIVLERRVLTTNQGYFLGSTFYPTNDGTFQLLYKLKNLTREYNVSVQNQSQVYTYNAYTYYVLRDYHPASFIYTAAQEAWRLTNSTSDQYLWNTWTPTGWTWNTNNILFNVRGFTGLSQTSDGNGGFPWKWTLISKRIAYSSGHVWGNPTALVGQNVYFVARDGTKYSAQVSATRGAYNPTTDHALVLFSADVPATIEPVVVGIYSNFYAHFEFDSTIQAFTKPNFRTCQHGQVGLINDTSWKSKNHAFHVGGDSGNPIMVVITNTLVNYANEGAGLWTDTTFVNNYISLLETAGLSTNTYWPTFYTVTNQPPKEIQ